jgi:hypothetical protein
MPSCPADLFTPGLEFLSSTPSSTSEDAATFDSSIAVEAQLKKNAEETRVEGKSWEEA